MKLVKKLRQVNMDCPVKDCNKKCVIGNSTIVPMCRLHSKITQAKMDETLRYIKKEAN